MEKVKVSVKRCTDCELPAYETARAAGADVKIISLLMYQSENGVMIGAETWMDLPFTLYPNERVMFGTGLKVAIPDGYELQLRPRSGLALKNGITLTNSPATIDPDYRGEIGVIVQNTGLNSYTFLKGERIAQMVLAPVAHIDWVDELELTETSRGEGGFGHTGK